MSYSKYEKHLQKFYEKEYPEFIATRVKMREILQTEEVCVYVCISLSLSLFLSLYTHTHT